MAKITQLTATNVLRLRAVTIAPAPDGSLVVIGGANGAGKSSTLSSIEMALGGKKRIPPQPLRKGAKRGKIVLELDNGIVVTRTVGPDGAGGLTVTLNGDEVKSPQTILDRLCGAIAFDPLAYSRMKPAEQEATLRQLIGLDTSAQDKRRAALYDARTEEGRELKRLKAQLDSTPKHDDAPTEEVKVSELTAELERRRGVAEEHARQRRAVDALTREAEIVEHQAGNAARAVEQAQAEITRLQKRLDEFLTERTREQAALAEARRKAQDAQAAAAKLVDPDLADVRAKLASVEETNRKVRDNAARAKLAGDVEKLEEKLLELGDSIQAIDDEKAELLAKAKLPLPGLGFDASGVTLDGVPLEQASQAERLRVSVGIGLAMNPTLRVLLVRDGALLDEKSLALVAEMAEAADAQVWLERVGDGDAGAVIIEDGEVRKPRPQNDATAGAAE